MGSSIKLDDVGTKIPKEDADFHRTTVSDILGRPNLNFPGAQPVSFARKHLRELEKVDYYVAEKTDGIRCLLFLTQIFDNQSPPREAQFLIDRKNDYYYIPSGYLHIPRPNPDPKAELSYLIESWHLGTILDGELVRQKLKDGRTQLTYLIFDIMALDGQNITNRLYDVRIGKLQQFVLKPWKAFGKDWPQEIAVQPFQLQLKPPQLPYALEMVFKEMIPNLPHGNDGLIFTCKETPYVSGTDPHILKWKPPHENTIDFRLLLGKFPTAEDEEGQYEDYDQKPEIQLQVFHGNRDYRDYAPLYLTDAEWEAMKGMNESFDCRIIECWREADTGRWRPKLDDEVPRFRDDKENANHISTVNSVLESIEDAVTEEELLRYNEKLRNGWKAREAHKAQEKERIRSQQHQQHHRPQPTRVPSNEHKKGGIKDERAKEEDDEGPRYVD